MMTGVLRRPWMDLNIGQGDREGDADITRGKWPTDDVHDTGSVPEGSVQALDPLNLGDRLEGYSESGRA